MLLTKRFLTIFGWLTQVYFTHSSTHTQVHNTYQTLHIPVTILMHIILTFWDQNKMWTTFSNFRSKTFQEMCTWYGSFNPYPSWLLRWHRGNHTIVHMPVKQLWRILVNILNGSTKSVIYNHNKTNHNKDVDTYSMGYFCICHSLIRLNSLVHIEKYL